jgi:hypothetical protein
MEKIDWKIVVLFFNVFQFVVGIVVFCIIKFNDMAHIDKNLKELSGDIKKYEEKNDERHLSMVTNINALSNTVSTLAGRCEAFHSKK